MKILIVGGGGREHAIAWRLAQYPNVELIAAPGNPGIAQIARCVAAPKTIPGYAELAKAEKVDLTVVGPEATLVAGIADEFDRQGLRLVGPTQAAARLEGSKIFAKEFFHRAGIPTARSVQACTSQEALDNIKNFSMPVVVKADGLAAGKGVIIAHTLHEAQRAIHLLGPRLVLEEFLEGEEVSFIGIANGSDLIPLAPAQDHKRVGDGDTGPNTGGMGAYSDGRILTSNEVRLVRDSIMLPALEHMAREGTPFRGFLYAGLMMTAHGPKVLEFNVRLGDPETQALLHRIESGFLEALEFAAGGPPEKLTWKPDPSVCVVMAAKNYPQTPELGAVIHGVDAAEQTGATVFHAGTANRNGDIVTSGGRVLGVTAAGPTLEAAIQNAYDAVSKIHFEGMHYRRDIGAKGLKRWSSGNLHLGTGV
ncbi:MAG TPA: phosphoribosylamine--glycine ligase [Bryobacteraceae bacterium]|nr:phosphoribosylamine--glycine ligase [Bryobacteraceae bacterium]